MIARLVWLLAVVAAGGIVGLLITRDPGYVLIAYADMALETSLWFALLLLVGGYVTVRLVGFLLRLVFRGRGTFGAWRAERRTRAADRRTQRGLILLAAGRWKEARRHLTRAAPRAGAPAINLLAAAFAAQQAGDRVGRDELLREARVAAPDATLAIEFTQATLEHAAGRWVEACAALEQLRVAEPDHAGVLCLLAECRRQQRDWRALADLLPDLRKHRVHPVPTLDELEAAATIGCLEADLESAQRIWAELGKARRHQPEVALAYAHALAAIEPDKAADALREALQHNWDARLVELYGRTATSDPARQFGAAEAWVKRHQEDPALFLALGRLALRNQRWAQAREHFEMSVRLGAGHTAQAELGRLCLALGEARGADLLIAAFPDLPSLPLPTTAAR